MTTLLARILLDVEALQLDKLLETESAQRDSFARVLPSSPCKILASVSLPITRYMLNRLTGLGKSHLLTKTVPASTCSARSSPFAVSFVHILAVRPNSLSFMNLSKSALLVLRGQDRSRDLEQGAEMCLAALDLVYSRKNTSGKCVPNCFLIVTHSHHWYDRSKRLFIHYVLHGYRSQRRSSRVRSKRKRQGERPEISFCGRNLAFRRSDKAILEGKEGICPPSDEMRSQNLLPKEGT